MAEIGNLTSNVFEAATSRISRHSLLRFPSECSHIGKKISLILRSAGRSVSTICCISIYWKSDIKR